MQITIKTNNPRNYMILSADIPVGARITSQPPIETKMFDLSTTLDVAINIDLDLTPSARPGAICNNVVATHKNRATHRVAPTSFGVLIR